MTKQGVHDVSDGVVDCETLVVEKYKDGTFCTQPFLVYVKENGAGGHADCNITIMLFAEVHSKDHHYLQQLAIIQRQMIEELRLDLIRCNHYGPKVASLVRDIVLRFGLDV